MVFVGGRQEEEIEDSKTSEARFIMAMCPERSRSLHNFSLPCLKWGGQRQLRCVKLDDPGVSDGGTHFRRPLDRRSQPSSSRHCSDSGGPPCKSSESERKRRSFFEPEDFGRSSSRFHSSTAAAAEVGRRSVVDYDGGDGIEAVRKKLIFDLQSEMDKMKFAVLRNGSEEIKPPPRAEASPVAEARRWNLRNRRAACKEPNANGSAKNQRIDEVDCSFSPAKGAATKSPAMWNDVGGGVKRPREKFSVSLSKQEIEEDFIALMGIRPPRRPKKRPRCVQRQLDTLFPGLWLSEVTADLYKVNEKPEGGKR